jgi:tetratricopeptide (TPR) repeat protein
MTRPVVALLAAAVAALGAYGCASPLHRPAKLELRARPLETADVAPKRTSAYDAAVAAIGSRDYGRALDLLQLAKLQTPDDPAVLNAFGVVYDKLGRLDLSARYYAQAQALDPGSQIVRRNIAYSEMLRSGGVAAAEAAETVLADAPLPQPVMLVAKAPPPIALIQVADNGTLLIGAGLQVIDASGQGLGQPIKVALARRGWSVSKAPPRAAPPQARTTITYPAGGSAVAHALARTLHGPVHFNVCNDHCRRVTLVVGQDSRRWVSGARS